MLALQGLNPAQGIEAQIAELINCVAVTASANKGKEVVGTGPQQGGRCGTDKHFVSSHVG
jgi:hypothetical protein